LSQRLTALLGSVRHTLRPDSLQGINKAEIQECVLALEQMKMLMSDFEVLRLLESESWLGSPIRKAATARHGGVKASY
jgi:hypothetical protein